MLSVSRYTQNYVDACRAKVVAAKPAGIDAFERPFFDHMILTLDHYFLHRSRTMEGKDGNPLNEVRMLCNAIMENEDRLGADKTIRYKPETSILQFKGRATRSG